jgi:AP-2 complex subunit alpha
VVTPELAAHLIVQAKPVEAYVESGAQVQQLINVECTNDYTSLPVMHLSFRCGVLYA